MAARIAEATADVVVGVQDRNNRLIAVQLVALRTTIAALGLKPEHAEVVTDRRAAIEPGLVIQGGGIADVADVEVGVFDYHGTEIALDVPGVLVREAGAATAVEASAIPTISFLILIPLKMT